MDKRKFIQGLVAQTMVLLGLFLIFRFLLLWSMAYRYGATAAEHLYEVEHMMASYDLMSLVVLVVVWVLWAAGRYSSLKRET